MPMVQTVVSSVPNLVHILPGSSQQHSLYFLFVSRHTQPAFRLMNLDVMKYGLIQICLQLGAFIDGHVVNGVRPFFICVCLPVAFIADQERPTGL